MKDELRASVRAFLATAAPLGTEASPEVWRRLCRELGLTALGPGDFEEVAVVLEETGRVLLRAPYLPTVVAAVVLSATGADDLLPALHDGSGPAAVATGGRYVADAAGAALLLVADEAGLEVHTRFDTTPVAALDESRPLAAVGYPAGSGRRVGDAAAGALARQVLLAALAAEAVGAAARCLELTVEHLGVREQFGRPLGSFQALRHRVADLTVELEGARSVAWSAARAVAGGEGDLPVLAPLALAVCNETFTHIAGEMIQLHGGIGFTWEHPAHRYFKRAWSTRLLHGTPARLRHEAFTVAGVREAL